MKYEVMEVKRKHEPRIVQLCENTILQVKTYKTATVK